MSLTVEAIIKEMEELAPSSLAEEWDNIGLMVGDLSQTVERVLVSLDVDERVIDEAISQKVNLIISHHPLFFNPIKNILFHEPLGKVVRKLIKHDIALFSAHTNLDIAPGGINDFLAEILDLNDVEILAETKEEELYKFVVFVPKDYLDQVRNSLCEAGAGHIGEYSHCTFSSLGEGTFLPLAGTKPFIGAEGLLEKTAEYRLETIVPKHKLNSVLQAMLKSHPYEEAAFDILHTKLEGKKYGLGRIGNLSQPASLAKLTERIKEVFKVKGIRVIGNPDQVISKVAVMGGRRDVLFSGRPAKGCPVFHYR
ncbi:MAG: Nif3-like dinuclear metal center hexameric protein [Bacillota bacterium]